METWIQARQREERGSTGCNATDEKWSKHGGEMRRRAFLQGTGCEKREGTPRREICTLHTKKEKKYTKTTTSTNTRIKPNIDEHATVSIGAPVLCAWIKFTHRISTQACTAFAPTLRTPSVQTQTPSSHTPLATRTLHGKDGNDFPSGRGQVE